MDTVFMDFKTFEQLVNISNKSKIYYMVAGGIILEVSKIVYKKYKEKYE